MIEEDVVVADEEDSAVTEVAVEEAAVALAATEVDEAVASAAVEAREEASVTGAAVEADEVLLVDVDAELLVAAPAAVLVVERLAVLEVDPTLSSSPTDTPVSLSLKARKCSSSRKTLPLASPSTARSAFPSRHQELAPTEQVPRPSTESGTLSDQSLPPVSSEVWI